MVHKWITDVRFNDSEGMAKVSRDGEQEDEDMLPWTRKGIVTNWNQVPQDVEAHNVFFFFR